MRPSKSLIYKMLILGGCLGMIGLCPPANAENIDPFQLDTGHWMSFEHYSDNVKRNRPVGNESLGLPIRKAEPVETVKPTAELSPAVVQDAAAPTVAAPTRPIELPIMPGVVQGYSIQVDSTPDPNSSAPHSQITSSKDGKSDLHLQEQNWQEAADFARQHADMRNKTHADAEHQPISVRMTFLPNASVKPDLNPERKPRPRLAELPTKPKPVLEQAKQTPQECAAVDSYKKKQLEAIQSDRQTLQALQSAIADLGLQKQLNFMVGAQQSSAVGGAPNPMQKPIATP